MHVHVITSFEYILVQPMVNKYPVVTGCGHTRLEPILLIIARRNYIRGIYMIHLKRKIKYIEKAAVVGY